jgi:hypothetical protein
MKLKLISGVLVIVLAGVFLGACAGSPETTAPTGTITEAEGRQLAEEYLRNSPTFQYDGIAGSIVYQETLYAFCEGCWGFVFAFQCAHAGYGDRTGQVLAQVITDHEAVIGVSNGQLDGGTIDEYWDMATQQPVTEPEIQTATHE